jgi:ParB family chromosome partitioning protein
MSWLRGERRLRAAKLAGLERVPCLLLQADDMQAGMLALIENLQRQDLDYIEEAEGIARLIRQYGISQEQASVRLGKSQSAVANKLRLLRHSPAVLAALRENHLSERHARALLRLPGEPEQLAVIAYVVKNDLNVAKTEAYIETLLQAKEVKRGMRKFVLRDVRLFLNSLNHNLELIRSAGIAADSQQEETENAIILTITIPKRAG